MYVVDLKAVVLFIRNILLIGLIICIVTSIITYDEKINNLSFFYAALIFLLLWNLVRIFIRPYNVLYQLDLFHNSVPFSIPTESINKIEFYSNGYKGEMKSNNYSVMNYFMGSEGLTKLLIHDYEKTYSIYLLIENEQSMYNLKKWIESLRVPVQYGKLRSIV